MSAKTGAAHNVEATVLRSRHRVQLGHLCAGAGVLGTMAGALASLWGPQVGVHLVLLVLTVGVGIAATMVDLREHRLPDRLTWPYAAAAAGTVVGAALISTRGDLVLDAVLGTVVTAGTLYVLALCASMGLGDVKYGLGLGLCTGVVAVPAAAALPIAAMLLAAPVAAVMWIRHGASTRLPLGPALAAAGTLTCLGPFLP